MVCHGLPTWHLPVCLANRQTRPKIGLSTPLYAEEFRDRKARDRFYTIPTTHTSHLSWFAGRDKPIE